MNDKYPNNRVRLKAIGGGGGKGQRIVERGDAARTGELVKEILQEVKPLAWVTTRMFLLNLISNRLDTRKFR